MKNMFAYTILLALVVLAGWFFMNKARNAKDISVGLSQDNEENRSSNGQITAKDSTDADDSFITLDGGLKIKDVIVGIGVMAKKGDVVATNYEGKLENGTKFDSSYDRGEPFAFILGSGQVIKGWDEGIAGMKVGGKRILIIPPELGYGSSGAGGAIPPNATLRFEVELLAVQALE